MERLTPTEQIGKLELREDFKIAEYGYAQTEEEAIVKLAVEWDQEISVMFDQSPIDSETIQSVYKRKFLNKNNKYKIFTAYANGELIGYALGYPFFGMPKVDCQDQLACDSPVFFSQLVLVAKPHRRQGVGTELKKAQINYAKQKGYQEITTYVAEWNKASAQMHRRLGFQEEYSSGRYRFDKKLA